MKRDTTIVRAAIHPALGIARVGNSKAAGQNGYFIGPEVPESPSLPLDQYKDGTGALKRQAAHFHVYGYNADGAVVAELTGLKNAVVKWTVHVANKKAAWYEFQLALDIREASAPGAAVSRRRNPQVVGKERRALVIDPGARTIQGCSVEGAQFQLDGGTFLKNAPRRPASPACRAKCMSNPSRIYPSPERRRPAVNRRPPCRIFTRSVALENREDPASTKTRAFL